MPKGVYKRTKSHPNKGKICPQLAGLNNPRWNSVKKECAVCKKDFWIRKSHADKRKSCSRECGKQFRKLFLSGENSPAWKGGTSQRAKYKGTFTDDVKYKAKKRDDFKCRFCDKVDTLQLHHINGVSDDSRIENLITLCASCHMKVERMMDQPHNTGKRGRPSLR